MNRHRHAGQKSLRHKKPFTVHAVQTGAALLVFFVLLFSAAAAVALSALNNRVAVRTSNQTVFSELAQAKEALLSFALLYPDYYSGGPGRLPCPDTNNDGLTDFGCTSATIDQLPSYILPPLSPPPPDNDPPIMVLSNRITGERFWYAITGLYLQNPVISLLNTDTSGTFSIDGQNGVVAVIIDAGPPVGTQTRSGGIPNPINYLEGGNQTPPDFVTSSATPASFNDRVAFITVAEIRTQMTVRVAQEIKRVLEMSGPNYPSDLDALNIEMNSAAAVWYNDGDWESALENYMLVPPNSATLKFNNCTTTFTITFGQPGLQRSTGSC
tara:strand:- start:153141 stop:154118 length:978 start_codon:yes stop_codon:yes gene_type:complete